MHPALLAATVFVQLPSQEAAAIAGRLTPGERQALEAALRQPRAPRRTARLAFLLRLSAEGLDRDALRQLAASRPEPFARALGALLQAGPVLTPAQRAGVVAMSLAPDVAARVLQHMRSQDVRYVMEQLRAVPAVQPEQRAAVRAEFAREFGIADLGVESRDNPAQTAERLRKWGRFPAPGEARTPAEPTPTPACQELELFCDAELHAWMSLPEQAERLQSSWQERAVALGRGLPSVVLRHSSKPGCGLTAYWEGQRLHATTLVPGRWLSEGAWVQPGEAARRAVPCWSDRQVLERELRRLATLVPDGPRLSDNLQAAMRVFRTEQSLRALPHAELIRAAVGMSEFLGMSESERQQALRQRTLLAPAKAVDKVVWLLAELPDPAAVAAELLARVSPEDGLRLAESLSVAVVRRVEKVDTLRALAELAEWSYASRRRGGGAGALPPELRWEEIPRVWPDLSPTAARQELHRLAQVSPGAAARLLARFWSVCALDWSPPLARASAFLSGHAQFEEIRRQLAERGYFLPPPVGDERRRQRAEADWAERANCFVLN